MTTAAPHLAGTIDHLSYANLQAILGLSPSVRHGTTTTFVDGDLIYRSRSGLLDAIDRFAALIVPHLDGIATVRDLARDLAAALAEPEPSVQAHVARSLRKMARADALGGFDSDLLSYEDEVSDIAVEHLSDGRTRSTVSVRLSASNPVDRVLVAGLLAGERSIADMIPEDSCLGQKLRLQSRAERVVFSLGGRCVAVRCEHRPTLGVLLARVAQMHGGSGPTVAYVSGPLEGKGPPRIYDGAGQRVGRPRDEHAAADVVGYLCNEGRPRPEGSTVLVSASLAVAEGRGVLLPSPLASAPHLARLLGRDGVLLVPTRRVLMIDGGIVLEDPFGDASKRYDLAAIFLPDVKDGLSPRTRAVVQLSQTIGPMRSSPQTDLVAIGGLVTEPGVTLRPLPGTTAQIAEALVSSLDHEAPD